MNYLKNVKVYLVTILLGLQITNFAQGDLLVSPLRVVFENKKVKEELNIVNIGNDTAVYSVSFLQYNMTEDGNFEIIEKPMSGQMFANPFLRIFPRTVTLAPREAQVVRLQYRKDKVMAPGEYRSHIYFRSEKNNKALGYENQYGGDTTLMGVQITPIFGISIPVIIHEGDVSVKNSLSNLELVKNRDSISYLKLTINRSGNISSYGDLVVDYASKNGKPINIGLVRGVSVYTTVEKRHFEIPLTNVAGVDLSNGKLTVLYISSKDLPYKVYAENEIILDK